MGGRFLPQRFSFLVHGVHGATATTDFPGASDSLKILQASLAAKRSHELLMSKQLRASTERRYLVVGYLGNTCPKREPEKKLSTRDIIMHFQKHWYLDLACHIYISHHVIITVYDVLPDWERQFCRRKARTTSAVHHKPIFVYANHIYIYM